MAPKTFGPAKTTRPTRLGRLLVRVTRKGNPATEARSYGMCHGL